MTENEFITRIIRNAPTHHPELSIGIGDDCAVIQQGASHDHDLVLKSDSVLEGRHFERGEDPVRIGRKAISRAISDFAAMAADPRWALVTLSLSDRQDVDWTEALYAGISERAGQFGITIVGGETATTPGPAVITIALTGEVATGKAIPRSRGRPGDLLFVTGLLGNSLDSHHLDFMPRIAESRWLFNHTTLHAMMDLSDGLAADLPRLAEASGCGYKIDRDALPLRGNSTIDQALNDGEDYELLIAIAPTDEGLLLKSWEDSFPEVPLTRIGELTAENGDDLRGGFDHFNKA